MAKFEFDGIVKHVGPITTNEAGTFRKRELILTIDYEGEYPQTVVVEAVQDKCDDLNLNEVIPGDIVTVHGNFAGREWLDPKSGITKVFNTLRFWKLNIKKTTKTATAGAKPQYSAPPAQAGPPAGMTPPPAANGIPEGEEDDLPF